MSEEHVIDDGGPAFPHTELVQDICGPDGRVNGHRVYPAMPGMSLRVWLAGQETLSDYDHPEAWESIHAISQVVNGTPPDVNANPLEYFRWECEARAKIKLMRADVMLAALKGGAIAASQLEEIQVRRSDADYKEYLRSRFEGGHPRETFMFRGHRWRYRHDSFDDEGEFVVLERPLKGGAQ